LRVWFWAWLVVAAGIAVASAVARDRASAPFAVGAACAAALEAAGGTPGAEWLVFAGVSSVVFIAVNRKRHRRRHGWTGAGRHSAGHTGD
jgi:membrane protein implicated in regulation of membrane protease activity